MNRVAAERTVWVARARMVPVAGAARGAALAATVLPDTALPLTVVLWVLTIALVAVAISVRRAGMVIVALALAASAASHVAILEPPRRALAAVDTVTTFEVAVTTKVEPAGTGGWRFSGTATGRAEADDVGGPVMVLYSGDRPPGLDLGARVRVRGDARATSGGDRAVVTVFAGTAPTVLTPPMGALRVAADLRAGLVALCAHLPGEGGDLLPGLAVGETSAVSSALDGAMKTTGLSHLTAVSGSNCLVITGAVFALAALMRLPRGGRVLVAVAALAGFVLLVTPEPSVVRAATMSALAMLAVLLGRPAAGISVLSLSVAVLLVLDPWLATEIGFALSVLATGALLTLAGPFARVLERVLPRTWALGVAVPLAAQVACAPLIVLLAPAVSLGGVLANVLAGPAATLATVLGTLACLAAGIPVLGVVLASLAWVPAQWVAGTARLFAALPGAQLPWWSGPVGVVSLAVVCAALAVLLVRPGRPGLVVSSVVVVCVTLGVVLGGWGMRTALAPLTAPVGDGVAACDVGQGDALVVRSAGSVAVIDTGPDPALLVACLDRLAVTEVDLLVLTHFDADHAGGVRALVGRVDRVVHGPPPPDRAGILTDLAAGGAAVSAARSGEEGDLGGARWRILWPAAGVEPGNDASVVVEVTGGGLPRTLFLGDLSATGQRALLSSAVLHPPYAVVKVAHHGSADQLAELYGALQATVGVISVGADNDYGHPRSETLDLLSGLGITVLRTDVDGLVVLALRAGALAAWTERSPPSDVAPGG
ncbi:ComEC/Rec2 family competence protein [Microbacterium gorillae]|uniref:ComEC/Rec2 family competence protein n=1 Tax=Microbacterium gorillae TaxID=1231063 RepID=UPI000B9BF306|nr:ComEC/Rec2 family competence protein [Microbacterium gorillae]